MSFFLEAIANHLYDEFKDNLRSHTLVFPNRRAGLYFLRYLAARLDKPLWAPEVLTIKDLFRSLSTLQLASSEALLFELFRVFRKTSNSAMGFDDFFFWGDMLLNDFDDADKYMAPAAMLFRNIKDIKEIDLLFAYLSPEQIEIIKRFWTNFDATKLSNEKNGFINMWTILFEVYSAFRNSLREQGLAYEGMIFRDLAEATERNISEEKDCSLFHFIGFNALNACERTVMKRLKKENKARFYWDYDCSYIAQGSNESAGFFLRENLRIFGNDMPLSWNYNTRLNEAGYVSGRKIIATSSDVAQVKLIPSLLANLTENQQSDLHHTAVILSDEKLIMPLVSSLPEDMGDINITMGYPLAETTVYTLIRRLIDLQLHCKPAKDGSWIRSADILPLLRHPLLARLNPVHFNKTADEIVEKNHPMAASSRFSDDPHLSVVFCGALAPLNLSEWFRKILSMVSYRPDEADEAESDGLNADLKTGERLSNEFLYRAILILNRLEPVISSSEINLSSDTYMRILDRALRMQSVPFTGEPLSGLQVMGILETRALDFKNIIMLSVNEGVMPAPSSSASFIPFALREAFGLPSINHQEAVYSYHFHRLLHRAENVTFVYNSNSEGLRSGEISHFLSRMKYSRSGNPVFTDLKFGIKTSGSVPATLERTEEHLSRIETYFLSPQARLSPQAINTWLGCSMRFYYRYVCGLTEPDILTSEIDSQALGNILHESIRMIYEPMKGETLDQKILGSISKDTEYLMKIITSSLTQKFRGGQQLPLSGSEIIAAEVIREYLSRIISYDSRQAPLTILHLEEKLLIKIKRKGLASAEINLGGTVDRIDRCNGTVRIVDYKTGNVAESIESISSLFDDNRKKDMDGWLQTLLYCELWHSLNRGGKVRPSVYRIRRQGRIDYNDALFIKAAREEAAVLSDYMSVREVFMNGLENVVERIFSPSSAFVMTDDLRGKCAWCPFRVLCRR